MATLEQSTTDLIEEIGAYMGWASPAGDKRQWCLDRLNEGYRRVIRGRYTDEQGIGLRHTFSFLLPTATLVIWPTVDSVVMDTSGATAVTAATATFYATMVGKTLTADTSGNEYTITAYTSSTSITVSSDASADDGDAFTITADGVYRLPSDWHGSRSNPVYTAAAETSTSFKEVTREEMDEFHRDNIVPSDPSNFWAIEPAALATTGQLYNVKVYPIPSVARIIRWPYKQNPVELTDSNAVFPVGGEEHTDTVLACARAAAEFKNLRKAGDQEAIAARAMRDSVSIDGGLFDSNKLPDRLGWEE